MVDVLNPKLWTERPVDETREVYAEWAPRYDADIGARGYHTPKRVAEALLRHLDPGSRPVLDFGCGTGVSGLALRDCGITPLHGTDITAEMLAQAVYKGVYDKLWHASPAETLPPPGTYRAIAAVGVISLGAAPAEAMDPLIDALGAGNLLVLSFNDPTLDQGGYDAHLDRHIDAKRLALVERSHGPHLDDVKMGSDVMVLRRL